MPACLNVLILTAALCAPAVVQAQSRPPAELDASALGSIVLLGEFHQPGRYELSPGDSLSSVIARAGGLTQAAHPAAAVLSREGLRAQQERERELALATLQGQIEVYSRSLDSGTLKSHEAESLGVLWALIARAEVTPPLGRLVIEADPAVLQLRPDLDIAPVDGDLLAMPPRQATLRVRGAVRNPGSLVYQRGFGARDYIKQAGGYTKSAQPGRAVAILPDGAVVALKLLAWNVEWQPIPPAAMIVVPTRLDDRVPAGVLTLAEQLTQRMDQDELAQQTLVRVGQQARMAHAAELP